jgi:hypothetical protein
MPGVFSSRRLRLLGQASVFVAIGFAVNGAQVRCTTAGASGTLSQRVTELEERVARLEEHAPRIAFVTSQTWSGDLGGIAGAQTLCNDAAAAAGLTGTFDAWLSTPGSSPLSRFVRATGPYVGVTGTPIAFSFADLVDGSHALFRAIQLDEYGQSQPGSDLVFTGTNPDGSYHPSLLLDDCSDWTNGSTGAGSAIAGRAGDVGPSWTNSVTANCTIPRHLYCFEQ